MADSFRMSVRGVCTAGSALINLENRFFIYSNELVQFQAEVEIHSIQTDFGMFFICFYIYLLDIIIL